MTKDAKNTVCRDTVKDVRWAQPWGQNFDLSDLMWAIHSWYLSCIGEWSTEAHCRMAGWKKTQDEYSFVKPHKPRYRQEVVTGVVLSCLSPAKGSLLSTHPVLCRPSTRHPDFCNCSNSDKVP